MLFRTHQIRYCIGALVLGIFMLAPSLATAERAAIAPAEFVEQAFLAVQDGLKSAIGSGTYRCYEKKAVDGDWILVEDSAVEFQFARPKVRVDLQSRMKKAELDRRVIVYDGTVLATGRFTDRISVTGSQGQIFTVPEGKELPTLSQAGFPWNPARMSSIIVNPTAIFQKRPELREQVKQNAAGNMELSIERPKYSIHTEWGREYDYQPIHSVVKSHDREEPAQEEIATWKMDDGIWRIATLSSLSIPRDYAEDPATRAELEIDTFQVNPEISPELFTLESLELHPGSRILDYRPDVKEPVHYTPVSDSQVASDLDEITETLKSLPTKWPGTDASPHGNVGWWLAAINVAVLLAIAIAWIAGRRKRGATSQNAKHS